MAKCRCLRWNVVMLVVLYASTVFAQAVPAARRSAGISLFGAVSRVSPAYSPDINYGATIGADFTRYYHLLAPSLEVRYTDSNGSSVGETTISGGLKLEKRLRAFIPYGDFLIGYGNIIYQHPVIYASGPYSGDNSFITSVGGGLDYKLTSAIAIKFDAQSQSWKLGNEEVRRSPSAISIGVSIDLPFLALPGRR